MRILHAIDVGFEAGGAERSVRVISEQLRERGHQVEILATDCLAAPEQRPGAEGVFATRMVNGPRGAIGRVTGRFWHRPSAKVATEALEEFNPDVVHLHTVGEFSPALMWAVRDRPRLLTLHGPEDWTKGLVRWSFPSASSGRLSPADALRFAYTRTVQRQAYLRFVRKLPLVIAPSEFYADEVRANAPKVEVQVVANGIELPAPRPLAPSHRMVFVGRLTPVKGITVLLEAMSNILRELPDAHLTIVGDGPLAQQVRAAADADPEHIEMRGWLGPEEVLAELEAASLVLLPSVWPENFATVVLESLAIGRPIVGTRGGGIPELITDGENGRLVTPGDALGFAEAAVQCLRDPQALVRMGQASAARADRFDLTTQVDRLLALYTQLASDRTS